MPILKGEQKALVTTYCYFNPQAKLSLRNIIVATVPDIMPELTIALISKK